MRKIDFRAMGCSMSAILDTDTPSADSILEHVPTWFEGWEQCFSRFRPGSELSQLNRGQARGWQSISTDLCRVIDTALQAAEWTGGLVVPTMLGALEQAGYTESFDRLVTSQHETSAALAPLPIHTDWHEIKLDLRQGQVFVPEGMRLDLGGIAKGWAAQHAAQTLDTTAPALIDAGGDIAISRARVSNAPWGIAVDDPRGGNKPLAVLSVLHGGVATSGRDYRRWQRNGAEQHHIIDPRTGQSAKTDVLTATIVAPSAVMAEITAKAVLILGSADGLAWIESNQLLAALVVLDDGSVLSSSRMTQFLS